MTYHTHAGFPVVRLLQATENDPSDFFVFTCHTEEFWSNFKFLLKEAKKEGIYNPIDYKKNPQPYCGMTITDNPYFDL